jgi:hypothetical protein
MFHPQAIVSQEISCKCCGKLARLNGVVDFHKNCEAFHGRNVLPLSGIPVYYYRCTVCGLLFTTAFDHFTPHDFRKWIYNDQYILVDPDYAAARPQSMADIAMQLLGEDHGLRILDYGGGNGQFTRVLLDRGYTRTTCFDPLVSESAARPEGKFDCIFCFEVIEHVPNPRQLIADLSSLLGQPGVIVFSTMLQPADPKAAGVDWWYVAPRNGHVSVYSLKALQVIASEQQFRLLSFNEGLHMMFRDLPAFAKRWFAAS